MIMKLQVTLVTTEYLGDSARVVRYAVEQKTAESMEDMMLRILDSLQKRTYDKEGYFEVRPVKLDVP